MNRLNKGEVDLQIRFEIDRGPRVWRSVIDQLCKAIAKKYFSSVTARIRKKSSTPGFVGTEGRVETKRARIEATVSGLLFEVYELPHVKKGQLHKLKTAAQVLKKQLP